MLPRRSSRTWWYLAAVAGIAAIVVCLGFVRPPQRSREAAKAPANQSQAISVNAFAARNQRTAVDITGRRMVAAALLIKALGGGWDASSLTKP